MILESLRSSPNLLVLVEMEIISEIGSVIWNGVHLLLRPEAALLMVIGMNPGEGATDLIHADRYPFGVQMTFHQAATVFSTHLSSGTVQKSVHG